MAPTVEPAGPAWLVLNRMGGGRTMLFTIAVILLVLWLLGVVSGYTLGNFIYVLLVIALVLFVVGLVSGRRVV
jgi:uncharacterized membrane protein YjdF